MTSDDIDYDRGRIAFDGFVRGDAMIGLIADVPAAERAMLDSLWTAAGNGSAPAFRTLGDCYLAALRSVGAFEGVDPADADRRRWSGDAIAIVDDENPSLQAAMRCFAEAGRLGDREALMQFARLTRSSGEANQRIALGMLESVNEPDAALLYLRGLVQKEVDGTAAQANEWLDRADETGFPTWEMLDAVGIDDPREA